MGVHTSEHTNTSPYFSLLPPTDSCIQKYLVYKYVLPSLPSVCPLYLLPSQKTFMSILRDNCCTSDPTSDAQSALIPSSLDNALHSLHKKVVG